MKLVVLGLSLSSAWGNGHAVTFRALLSAFADRGHEVVFLERETPWYAAHRDVSDPHYCRLDFYSDLQDLERFADEVRSADAVLVGSYVPQGIEVGRWARRTATGVVAFYDIDTPVTLARLAQDDCDYLRADQIANYDIYFSFTGGAMLERLERDHGAPAAFPWVGASSQGEPASLCALLPSLCGAGAGSSRRPAARSPALVETPAGITLRNDELSIDIARVGACAVRVRRADTGAETLLTFDLPDELVPCEARAVPDVLRDDGVAVRIDAQTPRWSQSVTVSLGDDGPALSYARATRDGAVTTHRLVNASAHAATFTLDGVDLHAAPGESLTVTGS